ncbi:restriction endonuclease subunit S [uncultured Prevotella sp.]|uniref:restriction endonuclease subunit S n=1 Tax=uncultured Prevotella sp. TaxID=159272 RepID=UPI0027E3715B|nr:restriction endonuclease subunit S [uncultured Prevotella sp.]
MMKPKIRFKGFEEEWKETIWGNHIVSTHTGTNLLGEVSNKGIPLLKMGNIQRGFFDLDKMEYLAANQNPPVNCIANYGDFFYNTRNTLELVGKGATWMKKDGIYAFNSNIAICKLDGIDTFFFNYLYNTLRSIKQVQARAKGTTSVAAVYMRDLKSIELALPHIPEQQAIASYFTTLDSQISASTSRLASLKQMKAASLLAMFPQEGETVPKIRFQNNRWQKYKVGDLCDLLTGYPFPGDKILTKGKDLLMRGINITEGSIRHSNEIDRYYNEDTIGLEKYRLQVGDLVIGMDGSKVGKNSALVTSKEKNSLLVQRVARLRNEDKNLIKLIQIAVGSDNFIKYVEEMKTSSAIPHISPADIRNFPLSLPEDSNERRLIASYFTSLDRQISLQSQRLEKLKQIKSACLDKMFV